MSKAMQFGRPLDSSHVFPRFFHIYSPFIYHLLIYSIYIQFIAFSSPWLCFPMFSRYVNRYFRLWLVAHIFFSDSRFIFPCISPSFRLQELFPVFVANFPFGPRSALDSTFILHLCPRRAHSIPGFFLIYAPCIYPFVPVYSPCLSPSLHSPSDLRFHSAFPFPWCIRHLFYSLLIRHWCPNGFGTRYSFLLPSPLLPVFPIHSPFVFPLLPTSSRAF